MKTLAIWGLLLVAYTGSIDAQSSGTLEVENVSPIDLTICTGPNQCTTVEQNRVAIDANWRWTHLSSGTTNCYDGNLWDTTHCPTSPGGASTCTTDCVIESINQQQVSGSYGCTASGSALECTFVTIGPYSKNVGIRTYMLDSSSNRYRMFQLLNKEFTFDVDVSTLECGLNGALYFVSMDADGGASKYPTNRAGAKYGTGYCDAQCPHDVKWINGQANCEEWVPSTNDENSGKGKYGTCCAELDVWEANKYSQAFTTHPCSTNSQTQCNGLPCGDNDSGDRYNGICDKDGCDFASYRMGTTTFYGSGSTFAVDTSRPFTIVTQFITTDGTDNGDLQEIRRFYVQDGRRIDTPASTHSGLTSYDSITEEMCDASKALFGDLNDHKIKGGLKQMGDAMRDGMVLVMSLWDDHDANMLWLDSNYPPNGDPSQPGVARGPCPATSGDPADVEAQYPNAKVKYSNIKLGPIGSTTAFGA